MRPPEAEARAVQGPGFERFIFFSDAVFAIAITLLVLDLKPSFTPAGDFNPAPLIPHLLGFALSFYVVGRYWLSHHQLFERIVAYDGSLLRINLAFLASIVFLPFSTDVVTEAKASAGAVIFYSLSVAVVGLLMIAVTLAARRPGLWRPGETRGGTARIVTGMAGAPLVFMVSASVAAGHPRPALWLLILLVPAGWLTNGLGRALERRIDRATS